jgi:hypothetical protein
VVSCDLVNREHNIGNLSTIITSLPVYGAKPLFGTVTKYNDIESQVRVDTAGRYNEIRFEIGSNTEVVPGDVLLQLYANKTMSEDIFRNYYGKKYEKVKAATPIEIRRMK